jgi:hypothetical protein
VLRKFTDPTKESTVYQPIGIPPIFVEVVITAADSAWLADLTHALVDDRIASAISCRRSARMP